MCNAVGQRILAQSETERRHLSSLAHRAECTSPFNHLSLPVFHLPASTTVWLPGSLNAPRRSRVDTADTLYAVEPQSAVRCCEDLPRGRETAWSAPAQHDCPGHAALAKPSLTSGSAAAYQTRTGVPLLPGRARPDTGGYYGIQTFVNPTTPWTDHQPRPSTAPSSTRPARRFVTRSTAVTTSSIDR